MKEIDTLTLRRELTRVLDEVAAGETYQVNKRGRQMAVLVPPLEHEEVQTPNPQVSAQSARDALLARIRTGKGRNE
jgi:prevent-host-death family protein